MANDYTRSEYLKIMLGNNPTRINELNSVVGDNTSIFNSNQDIVSSTEKMLEEVKNKGDRNPWQQFVDTSSDIHNSVTEGILGFFDSIGDFFINLAIDNNWGNKSDLEHARDYDWQGNLINFTSQFSVDALLSGDVFNADKWADAFSFNNGRESLNETQANSYLSYAPTQAQNITRGIASSIGNMLPSMAFAGITGGSSLAPMAVGAFASQTNEAYKESGDFGRSALSGLLSAGIEVGTELLVGKGLKAVGLGTNKVMGVFGKSASGGTSSFIKDFLKTMNEEGAEELVSALCQPLVDSIYKGSDAFNSNEGNSTVYLDKGFWFGKEDSVLTQYLSGAVSGGIMGGASLATQYKTFSKTGVNLINELEDLHKQIATGDETKIAEGTAKVIALMQAFNENSTSSQKSAVLEFLGNPRASIEILSANELESKLSDISDSLESNNNLIYGLDLYRTINRNFLTGYDLSFEDNLANNENAYIDNQNGKIVIRKDLQSGVSKALAHEILGHVVMNSLGKDFVDGTYNKVIKTGWYEKNKDRLDQAYKEKLIVGSNSYKQEVIANYLESFLAVDEAKTSSIVEEVLNKKGFIKRFASLMRGNDVTKFLKTNSIASEYLKSIQKLAGNGLNGNFLDAIQRVKNGYALTQYQRENFGDLINLLQYSIKFNQNLGDTTVDKIKIDLPTKFSGAFLSKYKKSFNIKIPKELSHYTKRPTDYISLYECLDFTDASNEMFTEGLAESKLLNAVDGSNPEFNNKGIVKFTWEGKEYGNKDLTGYKIYATIDTDNHTLLGYSYKNPEGKRLDFLIHHEDYIDDTGFNIWDVREESKEALSSLATRAKEVNDYILNQVDSSGEVPEGVTRNSNEISKILNESKVQNSNILDFGEGEIKEQNLKYFNELSSEDKSKIQEFSNEKLFADLLKTDKFSKYTSKDINLIHNNYLYFNALSEEAKADVMKISEGKYAFAEVASWKLFTNCSESDFKKLAFASEGNELTYDEMIELDVTKYLEKYMVEHPKMNAEDYPELIEKIKKEFIEQEITSKDIQKDRKALLVYGLPGAGKSTGGIKNFLRDNKALEFDNDIMKALPCLSEYYQDGLGAGTVQDLVSGAQEKLWATVLKGYNIVYPAVGKKLSKVKHEIFRLTEKGYEVELVFVDVTNQTSCNRALYRALQSGRYVSLSYIHNDIEEQPSRVYNEISKEIEQYGGIKDYANDRTINIKGIRKYDKRTENRASSSNSQRAQSQGVGSERNNVSENIQIRSTNGHSGVAIGTPDSERIRADVRELQLTPESSAQNTTATEIVRKPKDYYKLFADVHLDTKFDYTEAQKIVYATLNLLSIDNNIELDNDNFKTTINELFEKLNTLDSEARENYLKEVAHKTALAYAEENNTAVSEEIESAILSTMETVIDDFGSQTFNSKMNDRMQYLANVINNLRERARLVAKINKSFNSFRNSITKAKAKNLTTQDVVLNSSFYTDFQKRNPISKSGMSLTPSAVKNVYNLGEFYTAEKMEGSFYGFDENIRNSIDEVMSVIDALAQKAEGTYIPKFNGEHLDFSDEATSNWLSHIEMPVKVMEDYNNLLQFVIQKYNEHRVENTEKAKETASKSHDILTQIASKSKRSAWKDKVAAIRNTAINLPSVIANYLGRESQFYKLLTSRFNEVEQKYIKFNNQYQKSIEAIVKAHKIDLKAFRKNVELSIDNKHLKVSKDVIAGILATIETEGEFFGDDGKATNKIQVFDNATKSKVSFTIAQDDVDNLKSKFTTAELEAIEEIKTKILNGELKSEYISFMEKTTGITPEVEEKYFMTQVDSGTATIDLDKSLRNGQYLTTSGWGRSKERINHNKTFKVNGFFASTSDYIQDLSYRVNFTDYLDEMRMFLNAQFKDSEGHAVTNNQLIAEIIPNWEGAKGLKNYMLNILLHTKAYDDYDFVDKLTSGYQMATLGLNVSSIAKQLLSDFTTMGDVGFKNWFASKKRVAHNVKNYKQVKEHLTKNLEIFRDRVEEKGYIKGKVSSNNVAKSEWNNIISKTMFLMEKTDEFNNIVNVYSVAETVAKNEGFGDYGTETNSERATEIFLNLLLTTQSNNYTMYVSPLRAGYMGKIARIMFGMFASDNQNKAQLVNRIMTEQRIANERREIYEAMPDSEEKTALLKEFDSEYSDKNYHKKVVGTVAAFALNAAFLVLISEAIKYLTGKKDKDEPFFRPEELKSFGFELFANWIPYIGTFSNAIENNTDVSFFTVDKINSLINSISAITNSVKTGDANKIRTTIIRVGMNTSELFGIPMSNLYKYSSGIVKLINEEAYYKGFNWYNAFTSNTMSSAFKTHVQRNNFTSAVEDLSAWYSLYKTGENDRAVLLSIAKLYQNYSNIIAKNIPDYYFNESDDKVDLTSNQRSEFYSAYKRVNAPVREVLYSNYTDEVKAKVIKKLYDAYYETSKYSVLKVEPQSKLGKLIAFSKGNIDSNISNIVSAIQLINNQPNKSKDRSISFINKFTKLSKVEKLLVLKLSGYSLTETNENQVKSYLSKLGLTREEINKIL